MTKRHQRAKFRAEHAIMIAFAVMILAANIVGIWWRPWIASLPAKEGMTINMIMATAVLSLASVVVVLIVLMVADEGPEE